MASVVMLIGSKHHALRKQAVVAGQVDTPHRAASRHVDGFAEIFAGRSRAVEASDTQPGILGSATLP
jgi:hypothetical protein